MDFTRKRRPIRVLLRHAEQTTVKTVLIYIPPHALSLFSFSLWCARVNDTFFIPAGNMVSRNLLITLSTKYFHLWKRKNVREAERDISLRRFEDWRLHHCNTHYPCHWWKNTTRMTWPARDTRPRSKQVVVDVTVSLADISRAVSIFYQLKLSLLDRKLIR